MPPRSSARADAATPQPIHGTDTSVADELAEIGTWIRDNAWHLAKHWSRVADERFPARARVHDPFLRFGEIPAFLAAVAHAIERAGHAGATPQDAYHDPELRQAAALHARHRTAAGFERRELLDEFVLLREVLWSALHATYGQLPPGPDRTINLVLDAVLVAAADQFFAELTDDLVHRAERDALTGLLNRQAFHERVEQELARAERHHRKLTIISLDLDAFKQVNDTLGHLAGDAVLQRVGALLDAHTREEDIVGRLGGDEFAVALIETDERAALDLIRRIQIHLSPARRHFHLPPAFGLSYGTATYPTDGTTLDELLHGADTNMYATRGPGRSLMASEVSEGGPTPELTKLRVLVADDDAATRTLCASILEQSGFDLELAVDGAATIAQALRHPPDVLLLDLRMPLANGWEVMEALAADPGTHRVPVVMMTGADDQDVLDQADRAGIIDFVTKPFDPARLINSVYRVLEWADTLEEQEDAAPHQPRGI